jgi:lipopolysaccharide transport system permease protein
MFALAMRDVKLRYKQTALGVIWVVLQPLLTAGILSFVFGTVAHMKSGNIPYFIFSFAGLMGWNLFSAVLTKAGGSLVGNANLISKVFFPRLLLPLSSLPSALVDFSVSVGMLGVLLVMYHLPAEWGLLMLPFWIALLLIAATGAGLVATSLMVSYRDVGYVLPVALQILFYATPIAYPISNVPERLRFWFNLNPLSEIFEAIRWSVFGTGALDWARLGYAAAGAVAMLLIGVYSFKRMEQKFADVI